MAGRSCRYAHALAFNRCTRCARRGRWRSQAPPISRRASVRGSSCELPWASSGVWLKADTHVHTKFSDGGSTVDEVVDQAVANGCDVLAITDHTDGNLKAATPEYHAAIASARERTPQLVLITGMEWNVPPGKGEDHAAVLFPPEMDDAAMTGEFKSAFRRPEQGGREPGARECGVRVAS